MLKTVSMTENRDFRRLYSRARSAVDPVLVVYARKNGRAQNRLGITVGAKLGCAVERNRARRRIREAYRLAEDRVDPGWDIVVVARTRAAHTEYARIEKSLLSGLSKLGAIKSVLPEGKKP